MVRLADRDGLLARLMLLPAIVYILALVAVPFVIAIAYSFSDVTAGDPGYDWVGLDNYRANWRDPVFGQALWNTFLFTAATMVLTVVLANILALLLTSDFHGKWLVRFLVLLPWTTPAAIGAIAWLFMLDSLLSPIDWILWQVGLVEDGRHMVWLGKPGLAKASVIGVQVWRLVPLAAVIIMAGPDGDPRRHQGRSRGRRRRVLAPPVGGHHPAHAAGHRGRRAVRRHHHVHRHEPGPGAHERGSRQRDPGAGELGLRQGHRRRQPGPGRGGGGVPAAAAAGRHHRHPPGGRGAGR